MVAPNLAAGGSVVDGAAGIEMFVGSLLAGAAGFAALLPPAFAVGEGDCDAALGAETGLGTGAALTAALGASFGACLATGAGFADTLGAGAALAAGALGTG